MSSNNNALRFNGNLLPLWSAVGCLLPLTLSTVLPKLSVILLDEYWKTVIAEIQNVFK